MSWKGTRHPGHRSHRGLKPAVDSRFRMAPLSGRCLVPFHDKCLVAGWRRPFVMTDIRRRTRLPTLGMTGKLVGHRGFRYGQRQASRGQSCLPSGFLLS